MFKEKYKVKRNVHIIPTGIEIEKYSKNYSLDKINKLKKSLKINDEKVLIFVGRLGLEKSVDFLIENHKKINAKLLIIGDGPERDNLEKLVKKLKLNEKVIFTGKVALKDIGLYYKLGDIFVTALKTETQGLTVIEALAASLPVVAINDESFIDPIKNDYNGYLFNDKKEYINYINSLLDDKNKLARLSINAYESSLKFSNKVFATNVLKIYKIAVKKGRKHLFKRLFKGDKNDSSR